MQWQPVLDWQGQLRWGCALRRRGCWEVSGRLQLHAPGGWGAAAAAVAVPLQLVALQPAMLLLPLLQFLLATKGLSPAGPQTTASVPS